MPADDTYDASSIEVLEPLEAVRLRPGMYIGGIDERAYHHLAAEILDNSMDEAVAGHANRIEVELHEDGSLTVRDIAVSIDYGSIVAFDRTAYELRVRKGTMVEFEDDIGNNTRLTVARTRMLFRKKGLSTKKTAAYSFGWLS